MSSSTYQHATAYQTVAHAAEQGAIMLTHERLSYDGTCVVVDGQYLENFGGCSYLGLDQRAELCQAVVDAVRHYGTQFSVSRAFMQCPLYVELESLLDKMTGGHVLVTPTTTLGHVATLPTIVGIGDLVIMDRSVHASVQLAVAGSRIQPTSVSSVHQLEAMIPNLTAERVWYLLDGVYSMRGDIAPFEQLNDLMRRYPNLWLYVDDAHSTSWAGQHGRGLALEHVEDKSRLVVSLSLNKAFAAAGGAMVFPTAEMRQQVRYSGGPMIFSGPIQPPMLGAAVASAKLHLSAELAELQDELSTRIAHAHETADRLGLDIGRNETPIFFVRIGDLDATLEATRNLRDRGFYASPAMYPAVPRNGAGIRFTLTTMQSLDSITEFLTALSEVCRG
jgi:7-keto-8-aminopelargonate synthetase-like enzyme